MPGSTAAFIRDENAAIGPLYAVAILVLVAMAGIGFDYGRLMALDTELQNAADQAALAAATQLDGGDDAMMRARDAATNALATAGSSFVNETRFSNRDDDGDGDSKPITDLTFEFFEGYEDDDFLTEIPYSDDGGADAKVVQVTVEPRTIFYALTPVVGAFSDDAIGRAAAMLETAVCNVPPMMFCVPEVGGVADTSFPTDADRGRGLHLHMNANAADPWAPGNFGFLEIDYLNPPSGNPNHQLGYNADFLGCTGDPIESRTGVRDPEADALNSRFDFYSGSVNDNSCDGAGNNCPAASVRKNYTVTETITIRKAGITQPPTPACGADSSTNPDIRSATRSGWQANTAAQNFPKDSCFGAGTCNVFGDANWDISGYFTARGNFTGSQYFSTFEGNALPASPPAFFTGLGGKANAGITSWSDVLRYEVYLWEQTNAATMLAPEMVSSFVTSVDPVGASGDYDFEFENVCAYPEPIMNPPGISASLTQKDRRVMTVAAVDCTGLNGSDFVHILRWVDLFLVQPAEITGADKSFFTEIIGPAKKADNTSGFQYFGRRKAVLIR